jgi:hypothetical protein
MRMTKTIGTRSEVWHGVAKRTSGGLTKDELFKNKHGRIVSKNKYLSSSRENRLAKYGYGAKKGKFGYVKTFGGNVNPASVNASFTIKGVKADNMNPLDRALSSGGKRRTRKNKR